MKIVKYKNYTVARLKSGTIKATKDGEIASPTKPLLRRLAKELGVDIENKSGNLHITRQLGILVMRAIEKKELNQNDKKQEINCLSEEEQGVDISHSINLDTIDTDKGKILQKERLADLIKFYSILDKLEIRTIQKRLLSNSSGREKWPNKGIYFFFESNQKRSDSGVGLRVTRVGTHALKKDSQTTLWNRLSQHKGTVKNGGGNHRGSIFRLLVGTAIINKQSLNFPTWGQGNTASKDIRENELILEKLVSDTIGNMPFLYLLINDESGADSLRGYIERNSIALLSNYDKSPLDQVSEEWLGHKCIREKVNKSNLWNQNHVNENYDPDFLNTFEKLVSDMNANVPPTGGLEPRYNI